jgi:hypothetical protein
VQFVSGFLPTFTVVIPLIWSEAHGPLEIESVHRAPNPPFLAVLALSAMNSTQQSSPVRLH